MIKELLLSLLKEELKSESSLKEEKCSKKANPFIGEYCIIRTYSAGVFAGTITEEYDNGKILLTDSRRLWRFQCKKSIALDGVANFSITDGSKICAPIKRRIVEPIELIEIKDEVKNQIINYEIAEQE